MAIRSEIFGFRPSRYLNGSPWNGQAQTYAFSAAQANNAFKGDMVQFDATNRALPLADAFSPACPLVAPVVAGITTNAFRGVITGFYPEPEFSQAPRASLGLMFRLASTQRYASVVDDVWVVFEAEEAANTWTSTTVNATNQTADISYTAGSQITGISGARLGAFQTAAIRPWRNYRYSQRVGNLTQVAGQNDFFHHDVLIANSDLRQQVVGA